MFKNFASIGLAASIAIIPIVLAPMAATAQAPVPPDMTGHPQSGSGIIRAGTASLTPTVAPRNTATTAKAKSAECSGEAKARGLQGKPRKKFLAECKKGLAAE